MIANYMFKIAGTILAGLSNIFFLFVMPKLLGPAAYGLYVYVQNFWLQIFSFMEVNSTTYFAQQVAKSRAGQKLRNVYFSYWLVTACSMYAHLDKQLMNAENSWGSMTTILSEYQN